MTVDVEMQPAPVEAKDFQESLKIYYSKFFPFKEFYSWLSYGGSSKHYFLNREFSFTLGNDAYLRFQSFNNADDLKKELLRLLPVKIDIGAVYNMKPKEKKSVQASAFIPLERELVFDIDMTDYDEIRTCCSGADICTLCWNFMTVSIKVINQSLVDDFGFKNLLWVYSGRRGVHCCVCDDRARALPAEGRKAIVGYLELLKGGGDTSRKVNTRGPILHPHLNRSLTPCAALFQKLYMNGRMTTFENKDQWLKILAVIPDDGVRRELEKDWSNPSLSAMKKWELLVSKVKTSKKPGMDTVARDIIFQYSYPRLDSHVSIGLNHLLKSPFCVHPKTGRVCIPMDPSKCDEFDPFSVPKLDDLVDEPLGKTSELQPHLDYFKRFCASLQEENLAALRTKRTENELNLDF